MDKGEESTGRTGHWAEGVRATGPRKGRENPIERTQRFSMVNPKYKDGVVAYIVSERQVGKTYDTIASEITKRTGVKVNGTHVRYWEHRPMRTEKASPAMSINDVAARLNVSETTVKRLISHYGLPATQIGRTTRIMEENFKKWVDARTSGEKE